MEFLNIRKKLTMSNYYCENCGTKSSSISSLIRKLAIVKLINCIVGSEILMILIYG